MPGRYQLDVSCRQGAARVDAVASDARDVLVRVPAYGSLSGTVEDARGAAVTEFVLAYNARDGTGNEFSSSSGAWSLPWLAPGTYELTATTPEGSATHVVQLPAGQHVKIALRLTAEP